MLIILEKIFQQKINSIRHNKFMKVTDNKLVISIVSHGHANVLVDLLNDLEKHYDMSSSNWEVVLTHNILENFILPDISFPTKQLWNLRPRGFSSNHNRAFETAEGDFFLILNPDVKIPRNIIPELLEFVDSHPGSLVGPMVYSSSGKLEASARAFPSLWIIFKKFFGWNDVLVKHDKNINQVPWIAGMFQLTKAVDFLEIGGLDESFILYYEDADLCGRFWKNGKKVYQLGHLSIIHDAQRTSHKNLKYLIWHLQSLVRFLIRRKDYIITFNRHSSD